MPSISDPARITVRLEGVWAWVRTKANVNNKHVAENNLRIECSSERGGSLPQKALIWQGGAGFVDSARRLREKEQAEQNLPQPHGRGGPESLTGICRRSDRLVRTGKVGWSCLT